MSSTNQASIQINLQKGNTQSSLNQGSTPKREHVLESVKKDMIPTNNILNSQPKIGQNTSLVSVNSNDDHITSKVSEENTFTIKMSDANEKEKRLLKKLEQYQRQNESLMSIIKQSDRQLTEKTN